MGFARRCSEECLRPVYRREVVPSRGRLKVIKRSRRWRVGREGTSVLTVVPEDGSTAGGSSLIDEIVRDGAADAGGRRWRRKWTPIWPSSPASGTSGAGGWWCATGGPAAPGEHGRGC